MTTRRPLSPELAAIPVLDGPFRQAIRPDRRPLFDDACRRAGQILAGVRAEVADACDLGDAMAVPELAYVPAGRPCEDIAARFEELLAEADTAAERNGGAQGNMPEAAAVAAARNAGLDLLATATPPCGRTDCQATGMSLAATACMITVLQLPDERAADAVRVGRRSSSHSSPDRLLLRPRRAR